MQEPPKDRPSLNERDMAAEVLAVQRHRAERNARGEAPVTSASVAHQHGIEEGCEVRRKVHQTPCGRHFVTTFTTVPPNAPDAPDAPEVDPDERHERIRNRSMQFLAEHRPPQQIQQKAATVITMPRTRTRESHRSRPGHRRTRSTRAGPSDCSDSEGGDGPSPAVRLNLTITRANARYTFARLSAEARGAEVER